MTPDQTASRHAIGYVRVSTAEQAQSGLGLAGQCRAIRDHAKRHGLDLADVYSDEGISGTAPLDQRTGLLSAIAALHAGSVLLVARLDRLSRGDALESAVLEELVSRRRARIVSTAGEGTEDRDDPNAVLLRRILQALASHERSLISLRTKAALAAKKARGERVGALPYGQTDVERQVLELMTDARAAGYSYKAIADELNRKGFSTRGGGVWKPQNVDGILRTVAGRPAPRRRVSTGRAARAALAMVGL